MGSVNFRNELYSDVLLKYYFIFYIDKKFQVGSRFQNVI